MMNGTEQEEAQLMVVCGEIAVVVNQMFAVRGRRGVTTAKRIREEFRQPTHAERMSAAAALFRDAQSDYTFTKVNIAKGIPPERACACVGCRME